jgi:predicted transcriptional regulator of viral defense system
MQATKLEQLFKHHAGVLTYYEAVEAGINPRLLSEWVEAGKVERVQRGVYRLVDAPAFTLDTWLELSLRIPKGVICLLSAAMVHELTTFVPSEVFVALPNKAWRPKIEYPPVRYFYFSGSAYDYGIEDYKTGAGIIKLYSVEKTVADLLRYRNKLGQNLFLEALKTYLARKNFRIPKLLEAARSCGVEKLMLEYSSTVLA